MEVIVGLGVGVGVEEQWGLGWEREERIGVREVRLTKRWERKMNKQRINNMPHAFRIMANLSQYCSILQKIYHIPHVLNGLKLGLVSDMCQICSIWHISHIYCGCYKLIKCSLFLSMWSLFIYFFARKNTDSSHKAH